MRKVAPEDFRKNQMEKVMFVIITRLHGRVISYSQKGMLEPFSLAKNWRRGFLVHGGCVCWVLDL